MNYLNIHYLILETIFVHRIMTADLTPQNSSYADHKKCNKKYLKTQTGEIHVVILKKNETLDAKPFPCNDNHYY